MKKIKQHTEAIQRFVKEYKREPTAEDFDKTDYLPSARTIQRTYGGLVQLRNLLGLSVSDFTKGKERSQKAKTAMDECLAYETELFGELLSRYKEENVCHPASIFLFNGVTVDFRIKKDGINYLVDIFKANTKHSFKGCVAIKNKKYSQGKQSFYTEPTKILLVSINEDVIVPVKSPFEIVSLTQFRKLFL